MAFRASVINTVEKSVVEGYMARIIRFTVARVALCTLERCESLIDG
jgi:hypothetical protein